MKKGIPELNDLTMGINDPDLTLDGEPQAKVEEKDTPQATDEAHLHNEPAAEDVIVVEEVIADEAASGSGSMDECWAHFMGYMEQAGQRSRHDEKMICRLERDLAESLDDCNINNRCRSDMVNAIVRSFFDMFLPRLAKYRREKKSLFLNYKEGRPWEG